MRTTGISLLLLSGLLISSSCGRSGQTPAYPEPSVQQEMILIPGGTFIMGKKPDPEARYIDNAAHEIRVDSFWIDKYEVSNAQYHEFCEATGHPVPEFWDMDAFYSGLKFPDHPVVGVTWSSAVKYAEWAGKRLPTEAEWEYAARGGLVQKNYPYGDDVDSTLVNYNGAYGHALPVGSLPPNGYGLYDMAGNVTEWVHDFYGKDYYLESPPENPVGPLYGKRRVIRGGGWRSGKGCNSNWFRQSLRPHWVDMNVGFRCAKDTGN
jgi:iron(II)-dependent oxidoreductase